jgi:hypothetical protein
MRVAKNNCVDLTLRIGNMSDTPRTDEADNSTMRFTNRYMRLKDLAKELERENAALLLRCKEHEQFRHQHKDCDVMGMENAALRKDAERYRAATKLGILVVNGWPIAPVGRAEWDAAIDAAMEKKP